MSAATAGLPRNLVKALEQPEQKRSAEQTALIRDIFEYSSPQLVPARIELAKLEMKQSFLEGAVAEVMVTESARRGRRVCFREAIGWTIQARSLSRLFRVSRQCG